MFVEVLDHRGRVRSRTRLETYPARIGRGYTSDVIVDDPWVDASHASVTADETGALAIVDEGSTNGLRPAGPGARGRVQRLAVTNGTVCVVGHTTLRFVDPAEPMPPTISEQVGDHGPLARLTRPVSALALGVALLAVLTLNAYLGSTERTSIAKLFTGSLALLAMVGVWSGAWALAGRLLSHRPRFLGHLGVAAAALLALAAWSEGSEWIGFMLSRESAVSAIGALVMLAGLAIALYGHLTLATLMTRRARWRGAAGVALAAFALALLSSYAEHDRFSDRMQFPSELKPVSVRLLRAETPAAFTAGVKTLREQVDALAAEAP
jgi:FHA domain